MAKRVGTSHSRLRRSDRAQAEGSPTTVVSTSERCKATHDVPYSLRCVLDVAHTVRPIHQSIVQSGEFAGATVTIYEPHRDKEGNTW